MKNRYKLIVTVGLVFLLCASILAQLNPQSLGPLISLVSKQNQNTPLANDQTEHEAYLWIPSTGYGNMPHWEVNWSYAKDFLKDNMKWRLQASSNNATWYDADELLDINLLWVNDSYKVTLTLNTTNAPQSLYYRFDLACNKSLKNYTEEDGWEWHIQVPANDTENYTILFNWSDIKNLVSNGNVWFDRGVKDNFFWFRIQSVNKIQVGKTFVVDPLYGVITATAVSSYEWDPEEGKNWGQNGACRVNNSEYYLLAFCGDSGNDDDGWLRTIHVWNNNGTIEQTVVSSIEYDTTSGYKANVRHIPGTDKYVISTATGGNATLRTFQVWENNGTINNNTFDIQELSYRPKALVYGDSYLIGITTNVYAIVYTEETTQDGWIETWWIDNNGTINNTQLDKEEFDEYYGYCPSVCLVDSDTIAITYSNSTAGLTLMTYNITSGGIITNDPADSWAFDSDSGTYSCINKVGSITYDITYINSTYNISTKTVTIDNDGMITKSWIDTLVVIYGNSILYIEPFVVHNPQTSANGDGILGVTCQGKASSEGDGYIYTWNVSSTGSLDSAIVGSCEFETLDNIYYAHVEYINQSWYLVVYQGPSSDGWSKTFSILTNWASPVLSNESPTNHSEVVELNPTLSITVNDSNGDNLNISWWSNSSGDWLPFGYNNSVTNGTYNMNTSNFSSTNTMYWWRVDVSDGLHNTSAIYMFTTTPTGNTPPYFYYDIIWYEHGVNVNIFNATSNSTCIRLNTTSFNVTIYDLDGDLMNVSWLTNASGTWEVFNSTTNVPNGTYHAYNNSWIDEYYTRYYYNLSLDDGNWYYNQTFSFVTIGPPNITLVFPTNGSIEVPFESTFKLWLNNTCGDMYSGCRANVSIWENSTGSYVFVQENLSVCNNTFYFKFYNATSPNTVYSFYVNATNGNCNSTEYYHFTTLNNMPPSQSNPSPPNYTWGDSCHLPNSLQCITVSDLMGDQMNITWWSNSSGTWLPYASNKSINNGTYCQNNSNFSASDTFYYWSVNLSDGITWCNVTYYFKTAGCPSATLVYPTNGSVDIPLQPTVQIWAYDNCGLPLTINWYQNTSGTYDWNQTNVTTANTSLNFTYYNATTKSMIYSFMVTVDNGGCNVSYYYHFRTFNGSAPIITGVNPANNTVGTWNFLGMWRVMCPNVTFEDPDGDRMNFTIWFSNGDGCWSNPSGIANGSQSCCASPLAYCTNYTMWVNVTDNLSGTSWTNETFYFWTPASYYPNISYPNPANNSVNNDIAFTWNVTINQSQNQTFNWTIQCTNGQSSSGTNEYNGSKTLALAGLAYCTNYTIYVNTSTGCGNYSNATYYFVTKPTTAPYMINPNPANHTYGYDIHDITLNVTIESAYGETFAYYWACSDGSNNLAVGNTNGSKTFMLNGVLDYCTNYIWWVNATTGCNMWCNNTYYFTTENISAPIFMGVSPANKSYENPLAFTWNITLEQLQGEYFQYWINCSNGQTAHGVDQSNGSKTIALVGLSYWSNYTIWVNGTTNCSQWSFNISFFSTGNFTNITMIPFPTNGTTISFAVNITAVYVTIKSKLGLAMNITFYYGNFSSAIATINGVNNGTYLAVFPYANATNTKYFWAVNVTDANANSIQEIYTFTTSKLGVGTSYAWTAAFGFFGLFAFILVFVYGKKKKTKRRYM